MLSAATLRLVQGYFTYQDLGAHTLRGVSASVQVHRILGESGVQSRLDAVVPSGLTPLVGREEEVALLYQRWEQARVGQGQVVLLSGEAGIGKSRLVQVLKDHVAHEPHARIEWRGSSYHQQSALYPVIAHLHRLLQWREDETPEEKFQKLETTLAASDLALPEVMPLLTALLSLPLAAHYPALTLTSQRQRQKTLEALLTWFHAEARQQSVLMIVEDLHWIDPSTLELLSLLIDQMASTRLCLMLTARPEFRSPWTMVAHLTALTLRRFAPAQVVRLASQVAGDKTLPPTVLEEVVRKTDGVPLFVEELTKVVLESGLLQEQEDRYDLTGPLPPLAIPATLHDALMARLDRLAAAKLVAQLGAVIGRTFTYDLVQAVASLDAATLQGVLAQLVEAELVAQRGMPPQASYTFKHALIQDAAYQSLLRSTRQQYHHRIAQVLEERFPETSEEQPDLLAHHYTQAGLHAPAVEYWYKAGQRAVERSAHREAISHLHKGLEVLTALPDTPDRTRQELRFYLTLGSPLIALHGYAAPELADYHRHTRELCQRIGDPAQHYAVVGGLLSLHLVRADLRTARELAEELLSLAQGGMPAIRLVDAYRMLGNICVHLGEFQAARIELEQGVAIAAAQLPQHSILLDAGGTQDPRTSCLTWLALDLWALGYPDQARQRGEEGVALAQQLAHPFNLTVVFNQWLRLQHLCRTLHLPTAIERAELSRCLVREHGFVQQMANETYREGLLLAQQGQLQEGIAHMQQGWEAYRATGANVRQPMYLAPLAEAYGQAGQVEEGLQVLAEALAYIEQAGERWWEAELHRLKGELLLLQSSDNHTAAASCFEQALALARRQQAKSWELRAAMSLARLWQRQGKCAEVHALLAPVYGWFTEGFDTADLQDAKALLADLGHSPGENRYEV